VEENMEHIENQKILQIGRQKEEAPSFITEDVVEVSRAKLNYYKWISHLMVFLCVIALTYGVCATLAIMKLAPSIIVDPQIFAEIDGSQSLIKRERIHQRMVDREKLMIVFMKQYVELRNTYIKDPLEMRKRWLWGGLVSYLSTYKLYQKFAEEYPKIKEELDQKNASRSVDILSVERVGGERSYVWKVEFKTYDYSFQENLGESKKKVDPIITEKYWKANIQCRNDYGRRTVYLRLINPLGFVVTGYDQSEVEN
jgi:type IV secretory pathway component VirB8